MGNALSARNPVPQAARANLRLIIFCTSGGNGEEALLVPLRNKLGNVF